VNSTAVPGTIRRTAFQRKALSRYFYRPAAVRRMPRWLKWLLISLLLLLLLIVGLVSCHESQKPASLATSALVGPRLTTGPVCLEEAVDVSGSMVPYTAQRERAEQQLFAFARRELAPTDLFSVSFFAGNGVLAQPPTALSGLRVPPVMPATVDPAGTLLAPGVTALVAARASTICASRALIVITDGEIFDEPDVIDAALKSGKYTRVYAVIPADSGWGRPSQLNGGALDAIEVQHFHDGGISGRAASIIDDAKPLDIIFGTVLADLTGQTLAQAAVTPAPTPSH
jgi:hypothetical protein